MQRDLANSLVGKHSLVLFELLTYGLEGGPLEPEVILSSGECGWDELGPFYCEFPALATVDYARMERKALAFMALYGTGLSISDPYRQAESRLHRPVHKAINVIIQSNMAHLDHIHLVNEAKKIGIFDIKAMPSIPDVPVFEKEYKPRRRGQKPTLQFGKGTKNGRK